MTNADPPTDSSSRTVEGPQTNITGNVHGPVLSGEFKAPVHVGNVIVSPAWLWVGLSVGALVAVVLGFLWIVFNTKPGQATQTPPIPTAISAMATTIPTPTPIPELQALTFTAIQGWHLSDVVAANGQVWFASDHGLLHYAASQTSEPQPVALVPFPLSALAVEASGEVVWFSRSDAPSPGAGEGLFGRYFANEDRVEWLPEPVDEAGTAYQSVTVMQMGRAGEVWLGNAYGEVARFNFNTSSALWAWSFPASSTIQPAPPIAHVYDMAVDPQDRSVVWVAGSQTLYRWRDEKWEAIPRGQTGSSAEAEAINALSIDSENRAWLGHSEGLTLFVDQQPGGRSSIPCSTDPVLDVATTDDGVWVVTQVGLARLDLSQPTTLTDCATWTWNRWTNVNFWTDANGGNYRVAVDARPSGALTVWIIQYDTEKARYLVWRR